MDDSRARTGRDGESTPESASWPPSPADAGIQPGSTIGRFTVLATLGEGGMGAVYAARDPHLDRKVAIKLLHPEPFFARPGPQADAQTRLLREAQAMAKLSHPNVVVVHEVGTLGDRVFVAMEHVDGGTLADWNAAEERSWREVVDVFLHAGRGLAAAHAIGLVHRDFKPENVLVGSDGRVRVSDFGLVSTSGTAALDAGAIEHGGGRLAAATPLDNTLTHTGALLGTPLFMAPEQHLGEKVDARADQFSFCVSLYLTLYGQHPFGGDNYPKLLGNVCSGRLRDAPGDSLVPGYVRDALTRGLAVDPEKRFPSMGALLAALGEGRDAARRRRRRIAVVAALALLGIVALLVLTRADRATDRCPRAADRLTGVWDASRKAAVERAFAATGRPHASGVFTRVERHLDQYTQAWIDARVELCRATRVHGRHSEEALDLGMRCLDRRLAALRALVDLFAEGPDVAVLDRAVQASASLGGVQACAEVGTLTAAYPPPESEELRTRVDALRDRLARARALEDGGKYAAGLALADEIAAAARETAYPPLEAEALFVLASLKDNTGDASTAEEILRTALERATAARDDTLAAHIWIELLWVVADRQARHSEAEDLGLSASAAVLRAGDDDLLRVRLEDVLGSVFEDQGAYAEAQEHYERAASIAERSAELEPELPAILTNLGNVFDGMGEYERAQAYHERALALSEQLLGPQHPSVSSAAGNLGTALWRRGNYLEARALFERALAIDARALGPDHPQVAESINGLAGVLNDLGEREEARALLERALAIRERALGPDHPDVAAALGNLGLVTLHLGDADRAAELFERSLAVSEKALGADHPDLAMALNNLALARLQREDWKRAGVLLERALAIYRKSLGADHPQVAITLANLGEVAAGQGELGLAVERLERARAIFEQAMGPDHPHVATALGYLGDALLRKREYARACEAYQRALEIARASSADGIELAARQFALARAMWDAKRDRGRALELARAARDAYAGAGSAGQAERSEIERWLTERDSK